MITICPKVDQQVAVSCKTSPVTQDAEVAVNIDVNGTDFSEQIKKLDKKVPVAVYCRSGRRSKLAADQLVNSGYAVTELDGGIISWQGEIEK